MADQSSQSIVINAAPAEIMAVIADFPAYPDWVGAAKSCEVLESYPDGRARQVRFALDAGMIKDDYVLEYEWLGDEQVTWRLVHGQMQKAQHGEYLLAVQDDGTLVTYTLSVELTIPMLGMFKRKAEKVIMDTALKELKRRVEQRPRGVKSS
ncbi:MAG TPA: SRPBCC family protein [Mycobacteriales bacterium]|nr:SRPBCC family protein [Mycobacteriales bacterium]